MQYAVKKNIPLPISSVRSKYPLEVMDVGDCFEVPFDELPESGYFAVPHDKAKKLGIKLSVRKMDDELLYRVWRVA